MPTEIERHVEAPPRNLRVLVVDDDPQVRRLLGIYIAQCGHRGLSAASMQEALAILATTSIDVLVADVLLPDGDGLHLLNQVAGRAAPVRSIVVTGGGRYFGPDYFRRIGEALGATVLNKPFDRATFVAAIEGTARPIAHD